MATIFYFTYSPIAFPTILSLIIITFFFIILNLLFFFLFIPLTFLLFLFGKRIGKRLPF